MKILHLISGLRGNGAESVLWNIILNDKNNEHVVVSLGSDSDFYVEKLRHLKVDVRTLDMSARMSAFYSFFKLIRIFSTTDANLIQTWMYHADLLSVFAKVVNRSIPICWNIRRANTAIYRKGSMLWCLMHVNAFLSHYVPSAVVCCAEAAKESHVEAGFDRKKMTVVPNGYDTTYFSLIENAKQRVCEEHNIPSEYVLLGMVGRWNHEKNHVGLLDCLTDFQKLIQGSWTCLLIGSGVDNNNQQLVKLVTERGLDNNVKLVGPSQNMPLLMNAIDILILPSHGEGFPNVIPEAMACETPCIATDVGDCALIVGNSGWIVKPKNIPAMVSALESSYSEISDLETWKLRKAACRNRIVSNYSVERMLSSYGSVWRDCMNRMKLARED